MVAATMTVLTIIVITVISVITVVVVITTVAVIAVVTSLNATIVPAVMPVAIIIPAEDRSENAAAAMIVAILCSNIGNASNKDKSRA